MCPYILVFFLLNAVRSHIKFVAEITINWLFASVNEILDINEITHDAKGVSYVCKLSIDCCLTSIEHCLPLSIREQVYNR